MECPRHRVQMVSSETFWATRHEYGEPTRHIYTFACLVCHEGRQLECDLVTGKSVSRPYTWEPPKAKAKRIEHAAPQAPAPEVPQLSIF